MAEPTQAMDFDTTIHILQAGNLESASPALVVTMLDRWERELQGNPIFEHLSQLRQAILTSETTHIAPLLQRLGEETLAAANRVRQEVSPDVVDKLTQIGQLLTQAANRAPEQ